MNQEQGSISIVALVLATALLGAAGLVVDGGTATAAAARASDIAQDAARAGAVAGSTPQPGGGVTLDSTTAREAAEGWLAREGIDPSTARITIDRDAVTVVIHQQRPTALLRLVGIDHLTVDGNGAARPASGITKEGS
ncbi:MAG: hypothetical protein AB1679_19125 [Actinomycetota bacterium]